MKSYKIAGIEVMFPFSAYDCQIDYMEKVIIALESKQNALLESPTGTGKTLCLLCASLAWQATQKPAPVASQSQIALPGVSTSQSMSLLAGAPLLLPSPLQTQAPLFLSQNSFGSQAQLSGQKPFGGGDEGPKIPTIIYASRTHSQLQQVVGQLKASGYRPKMAVEGSRERMCIDPYVSQLTGTFQNFVCRNKRRTRSCFHGLQADGYAESHPDLGRETIVDIEDLVKLGQERGPCPYYLSRELAVKAEIVFVPYNYVIDNKLREGLKLNWTGSVLIIDEAHNVESVCCDAASFDLPALHLAGCIQEAGQCVEAKLQKGEEEGLEEFRVLKGLLLELERKIVELPLPSDGRGLTKPASWIYEFLADLNISWETWSILGLAISGAITFLSEERAAMGANAKQTSSRLESLKSALELIFSTDNRGHFAASFKVHISEEKSGGPGKRPQLDALGRAPRTLSFWCFNPGVAMQALKTKLGIRSLILTSGTLSPLDSFACELQLPFDIRLENPHVIQPSQIWVGVVCCGPSGRPLNSSFNNRSNATYVADLGNALVNFSRIVPDGLLVFFPSYSVMASCIEAWKAPPSNMGGGSGSGGVSVWERISKFKEPLVEPRQSGMLNEVTEAFSNSIKESKGGAIFFAVCRGKVSEGLDFADRAGRAVIITGIPYAPYLDTKVRLKQEYLDEGCAAAKASKTPTVKPLAGREWYVQSATRAVNQAVGRVIRHRNDYGAIILCDDRFAGANLQNLLSSWLRPHVRTYTKFGDANLTLTKFFRDKASSAYALKPLNSIMEGGGERPLPASAEHPPLTLAGPSQTFIEIFGEDEAPKSVVQGQASNDGVQGEKVPVFAPHANACPPRGLAGLHGAFDPGNMMLSGQGEGGGRGGWRVGGRSDFAGGKGPERQSMSAQLAASRAHSEAGGSSCLGSGSGSGGFGSGLGCGRGEAWPGLKGRGADGAPGPGSGSSGGSGSIVVAPPHVLEELARKARLAQAHKRRLGPGLVQAQVGSIAGADGVADASGGKVGKQEGAGLVESGRTWGADVPRNAPDGNGKAGKGQVCVAVGEGGSIDKAEGGSASTKRLRDGTGGGGEGVGPGEGEGEGEGGVKVEKRQRPQEVSAYIQEVKSRLGPGEFATFIGFVRQLKNQALGVEELLDGVAKLFAAASSYDLLERFGRFVTSKHHGSFETRLKAHAGYHER